jgi:hypothetical protein
MYVLPGWPPGEDDPVDKTAITPALVSRLVAAQWARGRGWALWKALIMLADGRRGNPEEAEPRQIIEEVIAEHKGMPRR